MQSASAGIIWQITAAAVALLVALTGCGVAVPLNKTEVEAQVPERASWLIIGQTDRQSVRAQFGEPWLASDDWAFDLFRLTGRDVHAPIMFVLWWPVPLGVAIDRMTGYVLVRYDAHDVVSAEAHGVARDASVFNGEDVDTDVQLEAADLRFSAGPDGEDAILSVTPAAGLPYLESHPPRDACRVLLGCDSWGCAARFVAGGDVVRVMPAQLSTVHSALLPMELPPGSHSVKVTSLRATIDFETVAGLTCGAGETRYGLLSLETERVTLFGQELRATLNVYAERPEGQDDKRIVVWQDGKWLVPGKMPPSTQSAAERH